MIIVQDVFRFGTICKFIFYTHSIDYMISIRNGVDIGRLNIYIRTFVSSNFTSETLIWALPGPQGQEWKHGLVPLQPSGRYQIIIEGLRGKSYEGDIALDDMH
jgi:hypothetical protein